LSRSNNSQLQQARDNLD